jgi:uncharacterized membrane protein
MIMIILAVLVGFYPVLYFIMDRNFGLLSSKSQDLLNNITWNIAFYLHIVLGGLALLIGWIQFIQRWREKNLRLHRQVGKLYMMAVLISAFAGFYLALFASGGIISSLGFAILAITWFFTTYRGYALVRKRRIESHRKMMIYSYAACFAAVTLRIWLPLLINIFGEFIPAYRVVAWLCWVPNMIVAYLIIKLSPAYTPKLVVVPAE